MLMHSFFSAWLVEGEVQKLVLVITAVDDREVLERWCFDIHTEKPVAGKYVLYSLSNTTQHWIHVILMYEDFLLLFSCVIFETTLIKYYF